MLSVRDNGIGLPADFALEKIQSLGLRLVRDLTQQLGGTLQLEGGEGTSAVIIFPNPSASTANEEETASVA